MIRIDGLGHRWTRDEIDTTAVMWQFFKSHQLRRSGGSARAYFFSRRIFPPAPSVST